MDLDKKEELLARLHEDVSLCADYLNTIANELVHQEITNYPIFVATQVPVEIGKLVLSKQEIDIEWSFYASHLEEFAIKEIITDNKLNEFKKLYKSHPNDFCLFAVLGDDFNFIFLPKKTTN